MRESGFFSSFRMAAGKLAIIGLCCSFGFASKLCAGQQAVKHDQASVIRLRVAAETVRLVEGRDIAFKRLPDTAGLSQTGVGLSISEETVKGHVSNVLSKLGANDRIHAVAIAVRRGMLQF